MIVSDGVWGLLRNASRVLPSHGRRLRREAQQYAMKEVSASVFFPYKRYVPREYSRTYQMLEGVGAESTGGWPSLSVSVFDTARNRSGRWGTAGFPYPGVVEFGQGSGEASPEEVGSRVAKAMGKAMHVQDVPFMGRFGYHNMPPRPFMTPAIVATKNWMMQRRLGRMFKAWFESGGAPRKRVIEFRGR